MSLRESLQAWTKRRIGKRTIEGQQFYYHNLTEGERASIITASENGHAGHGNALLIRASVVNEKGKREFSDTAADLEFIVSLDSLITVPLADAISTHCTPTSVEDAVKNSETTTGESSPSA